jgi:ectoine hydroxylase-related dioxygenase (phytanoyl-CoA dioxygenase family)
MADVDDLAAQVADATGSLRRHGWLVLDGLVDDATLDRAEAEVRRLLEVTPTGRDSFEGFATRRIYALAGKTRAADAMLAHPVVTGVCRAVLGEGFRVSSATTIAIGPGESAQALHYDAQVYPLPRPDPQVVVNSMWALTPFTEANGATRLVPGSHGWPTDRRPEAGTDGTVATIAAEMDRGSVLVYLGSLWHGGGANRTGEVRIGLNLEYAAGWVRQQENQYLVVPPDRIGGVPDEVLEVLGYSTTPPFLGYVDARDPLRWLTRNGYRSEERAGPDRSPEGWPLDA